MREQDKGRGEIPRIPGYPENWEITEAMSRWGGDFLKALSACWRIADRINRVKLQDSFPEEWAEYAEIVEGQRKRAVDKPWYEI